MYYDAFSRNVNQVIEYASALAKRFGCRYIGSEHILFGLLNVTDGRAAAILREAEVENDRYLFYFKKGIDKVFEDNDKFFILNNNIFYQKSN